MGRTEKRLLVMDWGDPIIKSRSIRLAIKDRPKLFPQKPREIFGLDTIGSRAFCLSIFKVGSVKSFGPMERELD